MVRSYLAAGLYLNQTTVYKMTLKLVVPPRSVARIFNGYFRTRRDILGATG